MNTTTEQQMSAALVATRASSRLMPVDISEWDVARALPMDATFAPLYFDEARTQVESHRAVVNEAGDFIAPVSFRYTIIQHRELLNQLTRHFVMLGMTPDTVQMHLSDNHARMRLRVFFNSEERFKREVAVGDVIQLGVEVVNRHDRSSGANLKLVAKRLACTNGMTVSDALSGFSKWHTGTWDGEALDNWLLSTTDAFASFIDGQMSPMLATPMTYEQFGDLLTAPEEPGSPKEALHRGLKPRVAARIRNRFPEYAEEVGDNAWAGYNAFTHVASHETVSVEQSEKLEKMANTYAKLVVA